jgi:hypothetical protein
MAKAGINIDIGANTADAIRGFKGLDSALKDSAQEFGKFGKAVALGQNPLNSALDGVLDVARGLTLLNPVLGIGITLVGGLVKSFFDSKEAAEQAKREMDEFRKSLDYSDTINKATSSVAGQVAQIKALAAAALNTAIPLEAQKNAMKQLVEVDEKHFGFLKDGKTTYAELASAVNGYTNALIANAKVKGIQDKISDTFLKLIEEKDSLAQAEAQLNKLKKAQENYNKTAPSAQDQDFFTVGDYNQLITLPKQISEATKQVALHKAKVFELRKSEFELQFVLRDLNNEQLTGIQIGEKVTETTKKQTAALKEQIDLMKGAQLRTKLSVDNPDQSPADLFGSISGKTITSNLPKTDFSADAKLRAENALASLNDAFRSTFQGGVEGIGQIIGDTISAAISGDSFDPLKAILTLIGDAMQTMGKALIAYAVASEAFQKALFAGPIGWPVALAAGVAAIALGAVVKNLSTQPVKFAQGGIVNKPTYGVFGEAGPEAIMPLHQLRSIVGAGRGSVVLNGRMAVQGRELVYLIEQEKKSKGRVF